MRESHLNLLTKIDEIINRTKGLAQQAETAIKKSEKISILTSKKSPDEENNLVFESFQPSISQKIKTEKKNRELEYFENAYKSNPNPSENMSDNHRRIRKIEENVDRELQNFANFKKEEENLNEEEQELLKIQKEGLEELKNDKEKLIKMIKEKELEAQKVSEEVVDAEVTLSKVRKKLFF